MVEYAVLIFVVLGVGSVLQWLGYNPAWVMGFMAVLTLPSVYAMCTAAPYLPTPHGLAQRMVELAQIQPGETVVDVGCGDGRLLRAAREKEARCIGYEISIFLYWIAKWKGGGEFHYQSFWKADLAEADVIFCYMSNRAMAWMEKEIWPRLMPGCRVVVHVFAFPNLTPTASDGPIFRYDKA